MLRELWKENRVIFLLNCPNMKTTEQRVLRFIDEKNLINKDDNILVALSGGPDSVFLLHFLNEYSKKLKISCAAFHVNHLLRAKEALKDEFFCKAFAEKLGVNFFSVKKNVKAYAKESKISVEEAGRIIRYEEFEKFSAKKGFSKIATAHNANDNAETVLLNLIKGAGLSGIAGIPPLRGKVIRPLLILSKEEIIKYLKYYKLDYRTDLSNLKSRYERNFLRNQIIPLIKGRLNPSLDNTLLKSSEVFRQINDFVKEKLNKETKSLVLKEEDHLSISLTELDKVEKDLRGEALRLVFEREFNIQLSFDQVKKIFSLIDKQPGRSIELQERTKIIRERNELVVVKNNLKVKSKPVVINSDNSVKINGKHLSIKKTTGGKWKLDPSKNIEFINGDNIDKRFIIRRWQPGDRFIPFGMRGSKKVSDFLSEQKLSSYKKKDQMVLINNNRIVWVIGLRLDDRFKITPRTKKIYELCLY